MAEHEVDMPDQAGEGASSTNYAELYKQENPDAVDDTVKAEAMAYAAKPLEEQAEEVRYLAETKRKVAGDSGRENGVGASLAADVSRFDAKLADRQAEEIRDRANAAAEKVAAAYDAHGPKAPTYSDADHQQNLYNMDHTAALREETARTRVSLAEGHLAQLEARKVELGNMSGLKLRLRKFMNPDLEGEIERTRASIQTYKDQLSELNPATKQDDAPNPS
jgi:hypothetical protein